jgi:uracil-DNA glycosylase
MSDAERLMQRSGVHPEWRETLAAALATLDPDYLHSLLLDDGWLPGPDRLLAAFRRNRDGVRYLLVGESPYPRPESANGIAFFDAAVGDLWSEQGLSKTVNRATSLRNLVKTMLLAGNYLAPDVHGKVGQQAIAALDKSNLAQSLPELFEVLRQLGFLMLNATPVLHAARKPVLEARYWQAFLERLLALVAQQARSPVTLLLWGKIAQRVEAIPASATYRKLVCEHPYNVSFIDNPEMLALFSELDPLRRRKT